MQTKSILIPEIFPDLITRLSFGQSRRLSGIASAAMADYRAGVMHDSFELLLALRKKMNTNSLISSL